MESQFSQKEIRAKRLARIFCLGDDGILARIWRSPQFASWACFEKTDSKIGLFG
jgi:muconolactone delta-isomerase